MAQSGSAAAIRRRVRSTVRARVSSWVGASPRTATRRPRGWGACATNFADIPRARLALVIGQANASITADKFNAYNATGMAVTTGSLIAVNMVPTARPISGTVTINPVDATAHRTNVIVTVNRKATGAGSVDVEVDANGA